MALKPAIEFDHVSFSWPKSQEAFLQVEHLSFAQGEKVFVAGPSGSGKTTLLGLMGGVLLPQKGAIRLLGQDLVTLNSGARDAFRADHIGFVFQMFNLLPYLNVMDNVLLGLRFSERKKRMVAQSGRSPRQEAVRLLAALGLADPQLHNRALSDLSVGQQQRVAVARALLGAPEILVADEPTSALDAEAREAFLALMFAECARLGTTLVYVSHDRGIAPLFDRSIAIASLRAPSVKEGAAL